MNGAATTYGGRAIPILQPSDDRLATLAAWFDQEYPSLLRFAYFVAGNKATAEDLVQDTFVRIYHAGARAERDGIGSYARRTIVNLHRTSFRRRMREQRAYERHGTPDGVAQPEDPGARDQVWAAMKALSPQQRACVALRYYEDMSERDVAETLGISVGAVKKQTNRAMTRLREHLGRQS